MTTNETVLHITDRSSSRLSEELESILAPYRAEYRQIVDAWIESGTFGLTYPAFLVETYHYVKHSCPLMRHAWAQLDRSNSELKTYMQKHIREETGHEEWVLNDLEQLGVDRRQVQSSPPLHETMNLIGSQLYVIDYLHPSGLLGYMYMLESQPPNEESLAFVQKTFGIRPEAMSFLIGHGEADPQHRLELIDVLDRLVVNSGEREAVTVSAVSGLSNLNRLLARIRSGDYASCLPRLEFAQGS